MFQKHDFSSYFPAPSKFIQRQFKINFSLKYTEKIIGSNQYTHLFRAELGRIPPYGFTGYFFGHFSFFEFSPITSSEASHSLFFHWLSQFHSLEVILISLAYYNFGNV